MLNSWIMCAVIFLQAVETGRPLPQFDGMSPEDQKRVEFLLRGMQSEREELRSGVARIRGTRKVIRNSNPERNIDSEIVGLLAFDFDNDVFRFDASIPVWASYKNVDSKTPGHPVANSNSAQLELVRHTINSVRTSDYFSWHEMLGETDSNLMLSKPDESWSDGLRGMFNVVDPRSLGLIDFLEFSEQSPIYGKRADSSGVRMLAELPAVVDGFVQRTPVGLNRSENRLSIQWPFYTLILNEEQGYTPVEYFNTFGGLRYRSETSWESVNDIWVPTMVSLEESDQFEPDDLTRVVWNLEWSHVNDLVPDRYQQFESFPDVPNGTLVIDTRLPHARSLGSLVDGKVLGEFDSGELPKTSNIFLMTLSIVAFVVAVSVWVWRSRGRHASTTSTS